ncbi:hypothetical protein FRC04_011540 [Tulasnella sp. 424]|nr:hypothetical protein FRC04_011540 [Tulasnella sp. 424]
MAPSSETSRMLLEDVLEDEGSSTDGFSTDGSSTEPSLSPPASPDVTHAEDIVAAPLLAEVADTNTPDSVDLPQ